MCSFAELNPEGHSHERREEDKSELESWGSENRKRFGSFRLTTGGVHRSNPKKHRFSNGCTRFS